jgi:hypothetical protein
LYELLGSMFCSSPPPPPLHSPPPYPLSCRYLADNLEWLDENLSDFGDEDYLLIDCPGQIELYSHVPVMKAVVALLAREGFNVCAVYLVRARAVWLLRHCRPRRPLYGHARPPPSACVLTRIMGMRRPLSQMDAMFITDSAKLLSGCLTALTAMVHLEVAHINVITKCDLVDKEAVSRILEPQIEDVLPSLNAAMGPKFHRLNEAFGSIVRGISACRSACNKTCGGGERLNRLCLHLPPHLHPYPPPLMHPDRGLQPGVLCASECVGRGLRGPGTGAH